MSIRLWLDDVRPPHEHGRIGWTWVKTADEAIALLQSGTVVEASLDHDLGPHATMGETPREKTGYDVVCWMEQNGVWPRDGVHVHSANPSGAARMRAAIDRMRTAGVRVIEVPRHTADAAGEEG